MCAKNVSFDVAELEAQPLDKRFEVQEAGVEVPSITSTPNHHIPVGGVDTLGICCWVYWKKEAFEELIAGLTDAQQQARNRNDNFHVFSPDGIRDLQVSPAGTRQGGGFPYRFVYEGIYFAMGRQMEPGRRHNMMISLPGAVMMQFAWCPLRVWLHVQKILKALGMYSLGKHTLSRVDLFADCPGIHVKSFRPIARRNAFVCRARNLYKYSGVDPHEIRECVSRSYRLGFDAVVRELRNLWDKSEREALIACLTEAAQGTFDLVEYGKTQEDLGYQFGKGQMVCRIYNKVRQLEKYHSERLPAMREAWCVGDDVPVTRVEFQMRSAPLRLRQITTIEDLHDKMASLVHELTHEWIVATAKYDGIHKERREIHRIWKRVQAYFKVAFKFRENIDPEKLDRLKPTPKDNGVQLARMALGFATTATARNCGPCVDEHDLRQTVIDQIDNAADHYGGWSELLFAQVNKAFEFENEMGLPFQGRTNRQVMAILRNETFRLCDELEEQQEPEQRNLQRSFVMN